jgi:futalosine hydrolase
MKIIVFAATAFEIKPFMDHLQLAKNADVHVCITGVGQVGTTFHVIEAIEKWQPDACVQAGIAGAYTNELQLGEVVLVKFDRMADVGASEKNILQDVFEMQLADENEFPFAKGWLVNKNEMLDDLPYETVKALTVSRVTDEMDLIEQLQTKYLPEVESMEGAAFQYVCLQKQMPFLQLRSISNKVGERDKTKWQMELAIQNLNAALVEIIVQMQKQ